MKVVFTARRLKPGHYSEFRKAWEPEQFPDGFRGAYLLRDTADPDQITVLGLFDVTDERARELEQQLEPSEHERHERMAPYVDETVVSGLFDVAHMESGGATGKEAAVLLTERQLKPGSFDAYKEAGQAATEVGGGMPAGLEVFMLLRDTKDPDHTIQFGIVRADNMQAFRATLMPERQKMLDAIEPFIDRIGLDTTYELVEEVAPVHA
ncbi:MAG TPA: hypothetical protein VE777_07950 [Gaiellales bacterium]|jgi:heme-degrading monooxygenase HmoA|nr:hypothetical protein [Gaiellales bacterium]